MGFLYTKIDYEKSAEVQAWIKQETAEQQARYGKIVDEMEALSEQREVWYQEFLQRIQDIGFNADGDQRVKIAPEDIPLRPDGHHKVVY